MTSPQILPVLDDTGTFRLYAQTRFGTDIAGPRLFRAEPWPEIQWQTDTKEEADTEAKKLQAYLDEVFSKRGPSKKKLREAGD